VTIYGNEGVPRTVSYELVPHRIMVHDFFLNVLFLLPSHDIFFNDVYTKFKMSLPQMVLSRVFR